MTTREKPTRYESSAGELSSPPSGELSEPGSPSRRGKRHGDQMPAEDEQQVQRRKIEAETPPAFEKYQTVSSGGYGPPKRFGLLDGQWIALTAAGMPRKKPGRKPGAIPKTKEKNENGEEDQQQAKARKPRKPRDSTEGATSRKRKVATATEEQATSAPAAATDLPASSTSGLNSRADASTYQSPEISHSKLSNSPVQRQPPAVSDSTYSPPVKRESGYPNSMKSILNDDTPSYPAANTTHNSTAIPVRTSGQNYDPIRGNYDPIRGTYSTSGSPRAPAVTSNRSPSIASLIEPTTAAQSPSASQKVSQPTSAPRFQDSNSLPGSPSAQPPKPRAANMTATDSEKKDTPPAPPPAPRPVIKESNFTTIANGPVKKVDKVKGSTNVSTPKTDTIDDFGGEGDSRSILDFGKAKPGEEMQAPTIVLSIPIVAGETNKYINFTRLAEERYGWDALHPRLAANRDRKARIAAATATLEKEARESGDEMSVDLSDAEVSNPDNGGTSNPDVQAKPKKKRNFKEDQYDVDDDFVDDSDMLWEAQAAASRDGFFVYSGPLVPEEEKPAAGAEATTKRGRGGRGSRGGRGGAGRGGSGTGRGGGPGSRGGSVTRKPRVTKSEKAQREKEKAERESVALNGKTPTNGYVLQTPALAVSEVPT